MKKILAMVMTAALILTGCNAKDSIKSVILKSYNVTCSAEAVVKNASTANFMTTVQLLDTPLAVLASALIYIDTKVTDQKVKDAIMKALSAIVDVKAALKALTPDKVDQTKATIINATENIKTALKFIGSYFGVEFPTVEAAANVADPAKQLKDATDSLADVLPKK